MAEQHGAVDAGGLADQHPRLGAGLVDASPGKPCGSRGHRSIEAGAHSSSASRAAWSSEISGSMISSRASPLITASSL